MSTPEAAVLEINLNDQQVDHVLTYAKANALFDGPIPEDADVKRRDAATLIYHARRARDNGNTSDQVKELCFIADVDQNPQGQPTQITAQPSSTVEVSTETPGPAATGFEPNGGQGQDYDEAQITSIIEALQPQAGNPAVQAEIAKLEAQLAQRRQGAAQQAPQVPPPAPHGASPAPSGQVAEQPTAPPVPAAPGSPAVPQAPGPVPVFPAADAGGTAGDQASQPDAQGQQPAAQAPAEDGRRAALEAQLSGQILIAYGRTFADLPNISDDDLERMVTNPGGPVAQDTTPTAPLVPPPAQPLSSERESLIEQITGPMLKGWRRGRVDIVGLTDDQLREMIQYPGGATTRPQGEGFAENQPVQPVVPPAPVAQIPQPGADPVPPPSAQTTAQQPEVAAPSPPPPAAPVAAQPTTGVADAIIAQERFPIAPEVESPPALPFDISKISDEQLRSVHAQFHAVLSRVNWVIAQHKDEIFGLKRALTVREVEARNALPKTVENKRVTKDEAAAMVAGDIEIVRLEAEIAEKERPLIKLDAIAENARSTCARASREWSFRKGEENPVMRGDR